MKKIKTMPKLFVIGLLLIAAVVGWISRFLRLNYFYTSKTSFRTEYHEATEVLPFSDVKGYNHGYSVGVSGFELIDYRMFIDQWKIDESSLGNAYIRPDRIALVKATVRNDSSSTGSPWLSDLMLKGISSDAAFDYQLFTLINPNLDGSVELCLDIGETASVNIPFALNNKEYSSQTWNHMNQYPFFFSFFDGPTLHLIYLQPCKGTQAQTYRGIDNGSKD